MLYFPSTNSAAHRPADRDVTRLHSLLDDDVWAFANCRVEAPGLPVAEIDWFFYNTRTGCLMVSEWKKFPKSVAVAADVGEPWVLADGSAVPNAIEQVTKQQRALRRAIERSILPQHFPAHNHAKIAQCVYSPQISEATDIERLQFGRVHGALSALASVVQTLPSPSPLLLNDDDGARLSLARALCALFRCSMSPGVEAKLRAAPAKATTSRAAVVKRISEIHREMAKLHRELAELAMAGQPAEPRPIMVKPALIKPAATKPAGTPVSAGGMIAGPAAGLSDQERMRKHLSHAFHNVNGSADAARAALGKAWVAVLRDPALNGKQGISLAVFGSAAAPMVKAKHESVRKLVGMQLIKWCLIQAEQTGLKAIAAPGNPSNVQLR
ncbi:hypothetical protein GCM10027404_10220 [Arthrobacter tumbae]|uniref:hypothetical protein n=1 Tax=Arthrobacter tumbae TaxID=163874 RepID=UPI001956117B|nr:hypothetical protein [Arthrobacter tumbae]MBM7782304.1 hypothetical protein [Arthrobacter tumbae]